MLFFLVVLVLGFFPRQDKRYWMFALFAVVLQTLALYLFSAGGTLEDPTGDGYITAAIRQATQDGPEVLWLLPFAIGLGWILPICLVYKGYRRKTREVDMSSS